LHHRNMDKIIPKPVLSTCPHCQAFVRPDNLDRHLRLRCPKSPVKKVAKPKIKIKKKPKKLPVVIVDGSPKPFIVYAGTFGRQ